MSLAPATESDTTGGAVSTTLLPITFTVEGVSAERRREVPEHAEDSHLSDLLARLPVVRVRSRLLGEVVVWVADSIEVAEEITEVVYRESELRRLTGGSPAEVRAVHEVKRALDGELM